MMGLLLTLETACTLKANLRVRGAATHEVDTNVHHPDTFLGKRPIDRFGMDETVSAIR